MLCFYGRFNAKFFATKKTAVFFVLPEEDATKHFLYSLFLMELYRELLILADEYPNKILPSRIMFFEDEFGTLPPIPDIQMVFSASRSRNILSLPMIQSLSQLKEKYGENGTETITDNCRNTLFSGFAPTSKTPAEISEWMGTYTIQTGSVSTGTNNRRSVNVQMMARPLMTQAEIKKIKRGKFVVLRTSSDPMKVRIPLFKDWGVTIKEKEAIKLNELVENIEPVKYVNIEELKNSIREATKKDN
jgi:type IV secretion system protein VirD4